MEFTHPPDKGSDEWSRVVGADLFRLFGFREVSKKAIENG
jgi:hypothetical protein